MRWKTTRHVNFNGVGYEPGAEIAFGDDDWPAREQLAFCGAIVDADAGDDGETDEFASEKPAGRDVGVEASGGAWAEELAAARRELEAAQATITGQASQLDSLRSSFDAVTAERDALVKRVAELQGAAGGAGDGRQPPTPPELPAVSIKLSEARLREIAEAEGVKLEGDADKASIVKLILAKRAAA